jgi:hypothetical protein
MLNELLNTACQIDRDYKISNHIKSLIITVKDIQPLIIVGLGYYKYISMIRYLL